METTDQPRSREDRRERIAMAVLASIFTCDLNNIPTRTIEALPGVAARLAADTADALIDELDARAERDLYRDMPDPEGLVTP